MLYPGRRWYFFLFALFLWHIEKDTWALEDLGILVFGFMVVHASAGMHAIHTYAVEDTRNGQEWNGGQLPRRRG